MHARRSLNRWSVLPSTLMIATPSPSGSAASIESASRRSMPGLTTRRSTTSSIVCFFCLSSATTSSSSTHLPSTRARTKPFWANCVSSFRYSPFRPRTIGARTWTRAPSRKAIVASTIWDTVWAGAARAAGPGEQEAEVVVDLGDGADGRARVLARRLLLDRDRGGETLDRVDVGLVHLLEGLAGGSAA